MSKRRFIEQLPHRLRTEDLSDFFSATVDHVFQPGKAEPISGYIGRLPSYYDINKDFYLAEPTINRTKRQLEPVMVAVHDKAITKTLFYDDLLNYLEAEGANISDEGRLFETDYYSWAPPVDLGKLTSPHNYFWFGDTPLDLPGLLLTSPITRFVGDGTTQTFVMPPVIADMVADEDIRVWVDGVPVTISGNTTVDVTTSVAPVNGSIIEVYRHGNLNAAITGKTEFDPSPFVWPSVYYTGNGTVATFAAPSTYVALDSLPNYATVYGGISVFVNGTELGIDDYVISGNDVTLVVPPLSGDIVRVVRYRDTATDLVSLSNGMRVVLNDATVRSTGFEVYRFELEPWDDSANASFMVDGVSTSIVLSSHEFITHPDPLYTVIDRRSLDGNPWSRTNMWVPKEAFTWSKQTFPDRVARRPIIEFVKNIKLHQYGSHYAGAVNSVLTTNGQVGNTQLTSVVQINGKPNGSVIADDGYPIRIGDRVLIRHVVTNRPDLSYKIVRIVEAINSSGAVVMALEPESDPGDVVTVRNTSVAYYYDIDTQYWELAQDISPNAAPLFALYDRNHVSYGDETGYPGNNFSGSKIFGYEIGTGTVDTYVGIPLTHDALGQIVFNNFIATQDISYSGGSISAMRFYKEDVSFQSDWHRIAVPLVHDDIIPANLQGNPDNEQITLISKNQWNDHFKAIISNQTGFVGDAYGLNNWHNTPRQLDAYGDSPLRIVQHASPMLKTMLIASDKAYDFIDASTFVENEYMRFRSRFINSTVTAYNNGSISDLDASATIARVVLKSLKLNKTVDFPFALNFFGDTTNTETFFIPPSAAAIGVIPTSTPHIVVDNGISYISGHDGSRTPLFSNNKTFVGDGTTLHFVLDQQPSGQVSVTVDNSPVVATLSGKVITLSVTPANGSTVVVTINDIRDRALLALETAIYQTLPSRYVEDNAGTGTYRGFELVSWINGCFRNTQYGYTLSELNSVLVPMFMLWVQRAGKDFRINDGYEASDPWTWNYALSPDRYGKSVPGHWRGIYQWYYDTDRPQQAPWEMLGFAQIPSWWTTRYGPAPYTSNNLLLWEDLRDGMVAEGPRAGIDARYVRADLLDILPVDEFGELRDPIAIGIIPDAPLAFQASAEWAFGDHGPVENEWRTSPEFGFARSRAAFLLKPARFVESMWDSVDTIVTDGQVISETAGTRQQCADLFVHGEKKSDGTRYVKYGIQQWISEYMVSTGQNPSVFGNDVRVLGVQLGHKMAGFVKSDNLRVMADNFGLVPSEDVSVVLYTAPSYKREFYSGVILEWSGAGWKVFGYDSMNPVFTIEENDTAAEKMVVSISDTPEVVITAWKPNVHYKMNVLVDYKDSVYQVTTPHTSTSIFEQSYWEARPNLRVPESSRVSRYLKGTGQLVSVPYGTEFASFQEVADFVFGYERYLISRGWVFEAGDDTGPFDWTRSVREFLEWATMQWDEGNFIALSPGASGLTYKSSHGLVYSLEQAFNGSYGIVDKSGMPINPRDTFVTRRDDQVNISSQNDSLYGVRLSVGEVEHALVFSNETIFGDIIYKPVYDLRQPRLRLNGHRATGWNGRFDAPGYVITKNDGILANFDTAAEDLRYAFEIGGSGNSTLQAHAQHLVGYESRSYLRDLLLSDAQQFEFYQGMIQQKGSPDVFNKMLRSRFIEQDRNLKFLEEWAFKAASYGGVDVKKRYIFELKQNAISRNPQMIRFTPSTIHTDDVYDVSKSMMAAGADDFPKLFVTRSNYARQPGDLPTAGYPRLDEVEYTTFNHDTMTGLYALAAAASPSRRAFEHAERIWVYDGDEHDWDVLRSTNVGATDSENKVVRVEVSTDGSYSGAKVVLEQAHNLTIADKGKLIVISGETRTNADLAGVHRIFDVGSNWIELEIGTGTGYRWVVQPGDIGDAYVNGLPTAADPENAPVVRALRSVRFATLAELTSASWFSPQTGEIAYVDDDPQSVEKRWVVRQYNGTWNTVYRVQPLKVNSHALLSSTVYDTVSKITKTRLLSEPLVVNRLTVIDPHGGIIPGEAERELSYKLEYDPARYSHGDAANNGVWGIERTGELWWDLSTVRFINPETDSPGTPERTIKENKYRVENWGKIAPGTQVDVYEWTRNLVPPSQYVGEGTVYRAASPSWSEVLEYDASLVKNVTVYYYWVKNLTQVTARANSRHIDAITVSRIIENSTSLDIPWIAPHFINGLLIGGVSQFLTENSMMQIDVRRLESDTKAHNEWTLLRPTDPRSLPTAPLWDKMIDSLAGMDRFNRLVPDPTLNTEASQGILVRPRQSLFGGSSDQRNILRLARESMTGMLNLIFSREDMARQRVAAVTKLLGLVDNFPIRLQEDTDTLPILSWSANDPDECALPIMPEYTYEVFSYAERNDLLLSPTFDTARANNTKVRVLINGLDADVPFWSVWEYNPTLDTYGTDMVSRQANAHVLFTLATAYTHKAATRTARDALTGLVTGDFVYVESDSAADGFWTLWKYDPASGSADSAGFVLVRAQQYRVGDFIELTDWFATGYSSDSPPVLSYRNVVARDAALGSSPATAFVKIEQGNDQAGWMWTAFVDGRWEVVAREKRTIKVKDAIFTRLVDANTTTDYAVSNTYPLANIPNRDGGMDLRAMIRFIVDSVLTDEEANELFFSMVHFAHAHFDQVNWAFKTSFLYVSGYNETMTQTAIQSADNTNSLINYLEEVKPYRVKIRDFARGFAPPQEDVQIAPSDFDKPVYFDMEVGNYRYLNPSNENDIAILSSGVWKAWYENYQKTGYDKNNYDPLTWNPIRRMKTTVVFDRVDGWVRPGETEAFYTGDAASRVRDWYTPLFPGQQENNIPALFNMDNGIVYDGGDGSLPVDLLLDGNGTAVLNQSSVSNRPEELVFLSQQDYVSINVESGGKPGAFKQSSKLFDVSSYTGTNTTLSYNELAQSNMGVAVFRDGFRADPDTDYTIDQFKREVTVNLVHGNGSRVEAVSVHIFGVGGITGLLDQLFYTFGPGDSQIIEVPNPWTNAESEVYVNGIFVPSSANFAIDPSPITISQVLVTGDDILINIRETTGTAETPEARVLVQEFGYSASGTWTIPNWESTRLDAHSMAIVEVDGLRLSPPETRYMRVGSGYKWAKFERPASVRENWKIYVDNVEYTGPISDVTGSYASLNDVVMGTFVDDFVYWDNYIVCVGNIVGNVVVVSLEATYYTISTTGLLDIGLAPLLLIDDGFPDTSGMSPLVMGEIVPSIIIDDTLPDTSGMAPFELIDDTLPDTSGMTPLTLLDTSLPDISGLTLLDGTTDIRVTYFTKPDTLGIETWTYRGRTDGVYPIYRAYADDYLWITVNGKKQVLTADYNVVSGITDPDFITASGNWDIGEWDVASNEYDVVPNAEPVIQFLSGHLSTDEIVITVFNKAPMTAPKKFMLGTTVPGSSIMQSNGDGTYNMNAGWEYNTALGHTGYLQSAITNTMTLSVPDYSHEIYADEWFTIPQSGVPGVVWIRGERIEYWGVETTGNTVVLSNLVRATKGTGIKDHAVGSAVICAAVSFAPPQNNAL